MPRHRTAPSGNHREGLKTTTSSVLRRTLAAAHVVHRIRRRPLSPRRAASALAVAAMVLASVPALATSAAAFTDPSAPFNECPAAGVSHSCGVLLVFEPDGTVHTLTDPASRNPYESAD